MHGGWRLLVSEFVGTFLLVAVGCSFVVLDFGRGSPVTHWIPDPGWRRALTGLLFGSTGASIALSPIGRESGAHINPVVSVAFWLRGKLAGRVTVGYVVAQCAGAIAGTVPLLLYGRWATSIQDAATTPGPAGSGPAVLGEMGATFCLIVGLFIFLGHRPLRRFTPALFPALYAVLVFLEAPWSGCSTNPARSLGPALVSATWHGWWVYWVGPPLGMLLGLAALRLPGLAAFEEEVAKLYHFDWDPSGVFHGRRPAPAKRRSASG